MQEVIRPKVGIIADTSLQGHLLSHAVLTQGYDLVVNVEPGSFDQKWICSNELDLWLTDITDDDLWVEFLDTLLDKTEVPILFSDGQAPPRGAPEYPKWERRLVTKIGDLIGRPEQKEDLDELVQAPVATVIPTPSEFKYARSNDKAPERVWVLGSSLGGLPAVKLFLDCLPQELPVAFVLAQHIDGAFLESLTSVLTKDNHFRCRVGEDKLMMHHGEITIAPVDSEIDFTRGGVVVSRNVPWDGPYSPSIDQTITNVCERYRENSGAILFSGMGNDGSISAPYMKGRGGRIWAQVAESCVVSSQPDAVRETGCVSYSGTPEQLALLLVEQVRQDIKRSVQREDGVAQDESSEGKMILEEGRL